VSNCFKHVTFGCGYVFMWRQCNMLRIFGLVNDVMCNMFVKLTSCFHIMERMSQNQRRLLCFWMHCQMVPGILSLVNYAKYAQVQSATADLIPVPPPDKLDKTYASLLILAHSLHHGKTTSSTKLEVHNLIAMPSDKYQTTASGNTYRK